VNILASISTYINFALHAGNGKITSHLNQLPKIHHTLNTKIIIIHLTTMAGLLGNLTNSLDNTLTGGDEQKGQGGLLGSVTGTVGKTVDGAGNIVGQTTDGLGNVVGQTTKGVADTAGNTTQGVANTAGKTTQGLGNTVGGLTGAAGEQQKA